jgi:Tol biopolymer transport system component
MGGNEACSIWLRPFTGADAVEVVGTAGAYAPFWSPDGTNLGFFADGKLKRVSAHGGAVQVICDAEDARGGSWGRSGTIIFAATRSSPIFRVPAEGGKPVAVTRATPASDLVAVGSDRWPHFLPDGEHFLYLKAPTGTCTDYAELHFASINDKQDKTLFANCSSAAFAAGRLVYWRDGNLVAQDFDPHSGVVTGESIPIAEHVGLDSLFAIGEFSASDNGTLLYETGEGPALAQLVWYERSGKQAGTLGEDDQYTSVAISRDGSRVTADTTRRNNSNIRIIDGRGTRTLVSLGASVGGFPVWSADGRTIYFVSNANGPYDILAKASDGSGAEQSVVRFGKGQYGAAFLAASGDGKFLAYVTSDPTTNLDVYTVPLQGDRKPHAFLRSTANESAPAFSPDSRWLAYESTQSGRNEVYITPFPEGGAQYQVSTNGGERPVWRRDGKEIFYREGLKLMAVEVKFNGSAIQLGTPKPLFEVAVHNLSGRWYDVAPDGNFLMNTSPPMARTQQFELIVNWPAELKK